MDALVTISTPVYNGANYIRRAVESILEQRYQAWELIVVDDGSVDDTASIVKSYPDPRIRYVYQTNQGQSAAMNHGLDLARGDYITSLDADDWLAPDSLACRVDHLNAHPACMAVYGDGWYCTASGEPVMRFTENRPGNPTGDIYDALVVSCFFGTGAAVMLRRSRIEALRLRYDPLIAMGQDWDFWARLAEHVTFDFVPGLTVYYRLHAANMTASLASEKKATDLIQVKRKMLASERFARVEPAQQSAFFYNYLLHDLRDRPTEQTEALSSEPFRALPVREQARLMRLTAAAYLLAGQHVSLATDWLRQARRLAPDDAKTRLISQAADVNPRLAALALSGWRRQVNPASPPTILERALALEDASLAREAERHAANGSH